MLGLEGPYDAREFWQTDTEGEEAQTFENKLRNMCKINIEPVNMFEYVEQSVGM